VVNSERDRAAFHVICDNRVSTDPGARPDFNRSQDLRARANVDVVPDTGNARYTSSADRNLLKYQTINANFGLRMDHDPVGVRDEKASANLAG
jgi:hypothetical protein